MVSTLPIIWKQTVPETDHRASMPEKAEAYQTQTMMIIMKSRRQVPFCMYGAQAEVERNRNPAAIQASLVTERVAI